MKALASLLIAACALCTSAHAQDSQTLSERSELMPARVGLHLASLHSAPLYNNSNPGVYAVWQNGLVLGALRNSLGVQSAYAGYVLESGRFAGGRLSAALTVGAITGYKERVVDVQTQLCPTPSVNPADIYLNAGQNQRSLCASGWRDSVTVTTTHGQRRDVQPLFTPSLAWYASQKMAVRLTYVPKVLTEVHALHLSLEWAL